MNFGIRMTVNAMCLDKEANLEISTVTCNEKYLLNGTVLDIEFRK